MPVVSRSLQVKSRCLELPDIAAVETGDLEEMIKLLELLLGCAVQCKDKERRVTELMGLEAGVKADLMSSIQLLMQQIDAAKQADAAANTTVDVDQLMADKDEVDRLYAKLKEDHDMLTEMYDDAQLQLETAAAGGGGGGGGEVAAATTGATRRKCSKCCTGCGPKRKSTSTRSSTSGRSTAKKSRSKTKRLTSCSGRWTVQKQMPGTWSGCLTKWKS